MGVPERLRYESSWKYISLAERLAGECLEFAARNVAARHRKLLGAPVVDCAQKTLYHVRASYRVTVTSEQTLEESKRHLQKAMAHLDHLESLLDMWFNVTCKESIRRLIKHLESPDRPKGEDLKRLAGSDVETERAYAKKVKNENRFVRLIELIDLERGYIEGVMKKEAQSLSERRESRG